ncbi:MAG TPA: adenylate/guanylate cyclase domain-containing protein [Saprospiraceae bacterium]|nr:adenylate/guanylate cyclase domain-containing protein [Saprospiraceae bacterium]
MPLWLLCGVLHAQPSDDFEHTTGQVDHLLTQARAAKKDADAENLARQSYDLARQVNYEGGVIRSLLLLGDICARNNRTEEALRYYLDVEEKATLTNNSALLFTACTVLGDLYFREKIYGNARQYYLKALGIQPDNYSITEKAADTYLYDMRFDSAEIMYRDLIVNYRTDGNNTKLVQIYQKLADVYNQNNLPSKALYYYIGIDEILDRFGSPAAKATSYNNLGKQYVLLNDYDKALYYFRKAELQCDYVNCEQPEVLYANLGIALHNTGKTREGLEYLLRARDIVLRNKDRRAQASLEHLITGVYFSNNDLYNALQHNEIAIQAARETKQIDVLAEAYHTAADIYYGLYDFEKAFNYYKEYLALLNQISFEEKAKLNNLVQLTRSLKDAESKYKLMISQQKIKETELQSRLAEQNQQLAFETQRREDEMRQAMKDKELNDAKLREQTLLVLRARQELRLRRLDAEQKEQMARYLQSQEQERANNLADSLIKAKQAQELEVALRDKSIATLTASKNLERLRFAYGVGGFALVILALLGISWLYARRASQRLALQNRKIEAQRDQIEQERRKSDQLLLNILPEEIAADLKAHGEATPQFYPAATVLFTDFINFTSLSAQLSPEVLIAELNECFLAFDEICDKNRLEKIKTIGDAYMCAGGLPVPNDTHAEDAVKAALEMLDWLDQRNRNNPRAIFRQMRIGIHTGPVIAGVVGKNKFAYDIWGDAVNLASRLEELGEPSRINISTATRDAVGHLFTTSYRGKKEVHNKGLVDMYFIEGKVDEAATKAV